MSKFKRIITVLLAMAICSSFCLVVNALEWDEYLNPGVTSAYAWLTISNWATEENYTDLEAGTQADSYDYRNVEGFFFLSATVELTVELDDNYTIYDTSDSDSTFDDWTTITAIADGNQCLNQEDHYGIIGFSSFHEVQVYFSTFDEEQDVEIEDWYCDGWAQYSTTS